MALIVTSAIIFCVVGTVLMETTDYLKKETDIKVAFTMKVYLFNVTNADDVIHNGSRPNLQEKGPYVFEEQRLKVDLQIQVEANTLSYRQFKNYTFRKEESSGSLDDLITIPNVPVISIVTIANGRSKRVQQMLNLVLNSNIPLYRTQSVKELLFDGYYDPFVYLVQTNTNEVLVPNATIGFFVDQNNTDDGEFVVNSEMEVVRWHNMIELPYWLNGSTCAMINGTDGYRYHRFITKDSVLRIFTPELYRSIYVTYEKETEFKEISAYRFTAPFALLADPTLVPENSCFCLSEDCSPSGLLNITSAKDGAPIILSKPHFYQGHPLLTMAVDGLKPEKDKHETFIDVEPTTGTVINSARRFQVNVEMKPAHFLTKNDQFAYMPSLIHPLLWIDEGYEITDVS